MGDPFQLVAERLSRTPVLVFIDESTSDRADKPDNRLIGTSVISSGRDQPINKRQFRASGTADARASVDRRRAGVVRARAIRTRAFDSSAFRATNYFRRRDFPPPISQAGRCDERHGSYTYGSFSIRVMVEASRPYLVVRTRLLISNTMTLFTTSVASSGSEDRL